MKTSEFEQSIDLQLMNLCCTLAYLQKKSLMLSATDYYKILSSWENLEFTWKKRMKIYLAGPMRGIKDFNFPAFMEAAKHLRSRGHEVFNPAENDMEKYGGSENCTIRQCLKDDLSWICEHAEAIVLLPGWERSRGVAAELATAKALDLEVIEYATV